MKILIVGCSFCSTLVQKIPIPDQWRLHPDITVKASSGAGNQALSAMVLYECSRSQYDQVIVFWSGINRLDTSITRPLYESYPGAAIANPKYSFCIPLGDVVWYHAGGIAGSWTYDDSCPKEIQQIFKTQYTGATSRYFNEISQQSILLTQDFLKARQIPVNMTFIYDIHATYVRQEHFFGKIDNTVPSYNLIDWSQIQIFNNIHDWSQQTPSKLDTDQFHPTRDAMREWILENFKLDIAE